MVHTVKYGKTERQSYSRIQEILEMPNLIGLSEDAAIKKLESNNLSYAGSNWIDSPLDRGTVVGQDVQIGESIEEHSKVTLQVSLGSN